MDHIRSLLFNQLDARHVEQVTLRLDVDVLQWFKSKGKGYQTQINALLREYMEASRNK